MIAMLGALGGGGGPKLNTGSPNTMGLSTYPMTQFGGGGGGIMPSLGIDPQMLKVLAEGLGNNELKLLADQGLENQKLKQIQDQFKALNQAERERDERERKEIEALRAKEMEFQSDTQEYEEYLAWKKKNPGKEKAGTPPSRPTR